MGEPRTREEVERALKSYDECPDRAHCATHKRTRRSELTDALLLFDVAFAGQPDRPEQGGG